MASIRQQIPPSFLFIAIELIKSNMLHYLINQLTRQQRW